MNMKIDDMSTDTIKKYLEGREEEDMKKDRKKIYYTSLYNPEGWEISNLTKDEIIEDSDFSYGFDDTIYTYYVLETRLLHFLYRVKK